MNIERYSKLLLQLVTLLLLWGCSSDTSNHPPVLLDVVRDISIEQDSSQVVSLRHVVGFDEDGDALTVQLSDGDNYELSGTTVTPDSGYIGDLFVAVQLYDTKALSNSDTLILSVVQEVAIQPLYTSGWWKYNDSLPQEDTVITSQMEVDAAPVKVIVDENSAVDAYPLKWDNLKEYGLEYLVGNDTLGQYQYGLRTPYQLEIDVQLQHMYPCTLGASWDFTLYRYNTLDSLIFEDTTVTMSCTDTAVYITVPAGIFKCIEYSFLYELPNERSRKRGIPISPFSSRAAGQAGTITEKVYYAAGVGFVQNLSYNGQTLIWKKVLTDYYVEEVLD